MYSNKYYIQKLSETYADTLEAIGVLKVIEKIVGNREIESILIDKGSYFEIELSESIKEEWVESCKFTQFYKYLKTKKSKNEYINSFNYEEQREIKTQIQEIKEKKLPIPEEKRVDKNFDIYSIIYTQQALISYNKIFETIESFKDNFQTLLKAILTKYHSFEDKQKDVDKILNIKEKSFTAGQLVSPIMGKGLNKNKANGVSPTNLKVNFISQLLRFSGLFYASIFKQIKIGNSFDTKAYVLEPRNIELKNLEIILKNTKPKIVAKDSIKLDIKSILYITKMIIEHHENSVDKMEYFEPKDKISGLKTVYYKDMGQNKVVTNISFLSLPDFIQIHNKDEADNWKELLDNLNVVISSIDDIEHQILKEFRSFLTETNIIKKNFDYFFEFSFLYFAYVMRELSKKKYVQFISEKNLKEVLLMSFSSILENEGFQAVAKAIRKSTISLQYAKAKGNTPIFEIKYGVAQDLKRKSENREDLLQYITEFIGNYNQETARKVEVGKVNFEDKSQRAIVKIEEIEEFVKLIDEYSPKTIAGLLASYGISINKKEEKGDNNEPKN